MKMLKNGSLGFPGNPDEPYSTVVPVVWYVRPLRVEAFQLVP